MGPFVSEAMITLKCSKKKKTTDVTKDKEDYPLGQVGKVNLAPIWAIQ